MEEITWQMHGKKQAQQHGQRLKQAAAIEFDWGSFFFGNDPSPSSNATNDNDRNIIATNDATTTTAASQLAPASQSQSSSQTASNYPPITPAPQQRQAMEMATPHSDEVSPSKTNNSQRHKPVINNYFISPTAMQHDQLYAQLNTLLNAQGVDSDVEKKIHNLLMANDLRKEAKASRKKQKKKKFTQPPTPFHIKHHHNKANYGYIDANDVDQDNYVPFQRGVMDFGMDDDEHVLQQRQHQARVMTYAQSDSQDVRRKHSAAINTHKIDPNRKAYYAEQQRDHYQRRKRKRSLFSLPLLSMSSIIIIKGLNKLIIIIRLIMDTLMQMMLIKIIMFHFNGALWILGWMMMTLSFNNGSIKLD